MSVIVRPAALADIRQMAELAGPPVIAQDIADWMDDGSAYAAWHLAEDDSGRLLGFQQIGRNLERAAEACEIATFFARTPLPPGTASRLFEATADAARLLRYGWIVATVAAENDAARRYYQAQGFRLVAETGRGIEMQFDLA